MISLYSTQLFAVFYTAPDTSRLFSLSKRIKLLRDYEDSYFNAIGAHGVRVINTRSLHIDKSDASLQQEMKKAEVLPHCY